ncbi:MAG: alpha/beta fold hydrolase [Rhizobiales bacterium]|nr:alpha/beta fold hydrolase [Hyphomicrobiales bacterium]
MTTHINSRPALIEALDNTSTRRTTPVGGGDLVWRIWGSGSPLLLLHGGTGSWMHWMRNIEDLSRDYTLLVPDIPGSGESASPHLPTNVEKVAVALLAGIDVILGPERRFAVAAFSMGGLVSGYVAKLAGERVTTLVLVGAVGTTARRPEIAPMKSWRRLSTDEAKCEAHRTNLSILMVHDPKAIDEPALYMQFNNAERSRVRGKHINPTGDLSQTLPGFKGRLASIWGEHDATAGPYLFERREKLEQFKPGATFDVISGAGHWVQYEAPDAFNRLLRERLKD